MRYLPINLDVSGKKVVVIGGGNVASRKCNILVDAGAHVTVIAPRISPTLQALAHDQVIIHLEREYRTGDLAGSYLVFAATGNQVVNLLVAEEAGKLGVPANIADAPRSCSFTMPATLTRGDLVLTVSTGGKSPAFATRLRKELSERYGPEYSSVLILLGRLREKLLTHNAASAYNKEILNDFLGLDLATLMKNRRFGELDNLLERYFGSGFTLASLGLEEKDLT